jgi:putative membrane protein
LQTSWLSLCTDWDIPPWVTCALVVAGLVYVRGWLALRRTRPETLPLWRLLSFLAGIVAIFVALSSPLDTYSETLLFMHMAQHFVLMSVAPPLIVLSCPVVPMLRGLPRSIVRRIGGPFLRSSVAHRVQELLSQLHSRWPRTTGITLSTSAFSRRVSCFGGPFCSHGRHDPGLTPG